MPLRVCTGFEFGAAAGLTTGNTGNKVVDSITGAPNVSTAAKRSGTYGLQIANSASSYSYGWSTATLGTSQNRGVASFWIKFPVSLPGSSVIVARWQMVTLNAEVRYNASTGKIRVACEGGTAADGPTISADTWYHIEIYFDTSAATYTLDWWVDGVAQTQCTTSTSAQSLGTFELGDSTDSQTFTAYYDDVLIWTDTAEISGAPFGPHHVEPLLVDPSGTVTLSGTSSNFSTFAGSTPTLSAWDATTARDAIDELPPNTGSSQDGFCQTANATTNYVEIPMTSYTLDTGEAVTGARMCACCWAASTTGASLGFRSHNGTTETTLLAAADINADNTTTPAWVCRMLTVADIDTQTELNALAMRVGFSGDASPDVGIHAILVELAVTEAVSGDATATPAALAVAATLPQAAAGVGAAPSQLATAATLPQASAGVGAGPAALTVPATLPQPLVSTQAAPAALPVTVSVPTPAAGSPTLATPSAVAVAVSVPQPAVSVATAPAALAAPASLPQASAGVGAAPSGLAVLVSLPQPQVGAGAAPAALAAPVSLPQAGAAVGVTPAALSAVVSLPTAALSVGAVPAALAVAVSVPQPSTPGAGDIIVSPAAISATVALPAATVSVGVAPGQLQVAVDVPRPGIPATVSVPAAVTAAVALPGPTSHIGAGPSALLVPVGLPAPGWSSGAAPAALQVAVSLPQPLATRYEPILVGLDVSGSVGGLDGVGSVGSVETVGSVASGLVG